MIAEILNAKGNVVNRIDAGIEFLNTYHEGRWRHAPDDATPMAERFGELIKSVDMIAANKMRAGYPHDFGGSIGVKVLQTRDQEPNDDRKNWLAVASAASIMVSLGKGAEPLGTLRTLDNVNVPVTAVQAQLVMLQMQVYLGAILSYSWTLKDQLRAATPEQLDTIDINAGWPA